MNDDVAAGSWSDVLVFFHYLLKESFIDFQIRADASCPPTGWILVGNFIIHSLWLHVLCEFKQREVQFQLVVVVQHGLLRKSFQRRFSFHAALSHCELVRAVRETSPGGNDFSATKEGFTGSSIQWKQPAESSSWSLHVAAFRSKPASTSRLPLRPSSNTLFVSTSSSFQFSFHQCEVASLLPPPVPLYLNMLEE